MSNQALTFSSTTIRNLCKDIVDWMMLYYHEATNMAFRTVSCINCIRGSLSSNAPREKSHSFVKTLSHPIHLRPTTSSLFCLISIEFVMRSGFTLDRTFSMLSYSFTISLRNKCTASFDVRSFQSGILPVGNVCMVMFSAT